MKFLLAVAPGLLALALAATLAACVDDTETAPAPVAATAPQARSMVNDCRAPGAQSAQRGCKPVTRAVATQ